MKTGWVEKKKRRRILAAGLLIGAVFWTASILAVPEKKIARFNYLTLHPEIRWLQGGSFLISTVTAASLALDAAYEKILPRLQPLPGKADSLLKHPLNWLIFALMTHTVYIQNVLVAGTDLFTVLYLTAYQVAAK